MPSVSQMSDFRYLKSVKLRFKQLWAFFGFVEEPNPNKSQWTTGTKRKHHKGAKEKSEAQDWAVIVLILHLIGWQGAASFPDFLHNEVEPWKPMLHRNTFETR